MINCVFSVRDAKLGAFSQPFLMPNKPSAIRLFSDSLKNPQSPAAEHPEDYSLHYLGTFDDNTGRYENAALNELLCVANELLAGVPLKVA